MMAEVGDIPDTPSHPEPWDMRATTLIGAVLMGTTVTLTFAQIVLRTLFDAPQTWLEEVSRYIFVWVVFLGAAMAFHRGSHVRLDLADTLLRGRALTALARFRLTVEALACLLLVYSGALVAWRNRASAFYSLPEVPQVVFYLAVPVCGAVSVWFLLRRMFSGRAAGQEG